MDEGFYLQIQEIRDKWKDIDEEGWIILKRILEN
jgi:hypothetical protein